MPVVALLALLIAVAYGGSVRNEFVHDDTLFMKQDPRVRSVEQLPRLLVESRWAFRDRDGRHSVDQYYRPFEPLPYVVSHLLFGGAPWPSHLLNLFFHFGNCLLVLAALRRVLGDTQAALLGAILFAIHPGLSEAVLWPAAQGGLGAFACAMAVFLLHTGTRADRWYARPLTAVLFLCGLFFKETGILALVAVGLYDVLLAPERGWARLWRLRWRYAAFVPPLVLYAVLRMHALGAAVPGFNYVPLTAHELVLNAVALLPQYARTFLWPLDLNLHHDFEAVHGIGNWPFAMGTALLLGAVLAFACSVRAYPPVAFGVAWALLAVAPYLLVHVPQGNVFAERYLYDPAFGACVVLGYGWSRLRPRVMLRGGRMVACGLAVAALLLLTIDVRRTWEWRDEVTLYTKTLSQSARAEVIRVNLAVRFLDLGRYDDGIAVLKELVAFAPTFRGAWYNLGLLYQRKGMSEKAIAAYEHARRTDPQNTAALLNLGYLYDQQGREAAALKTYFRLLDLAPHHADAWYNLAAIALAHGQLNNARAAAQQALSAAPNDPQMRALVARIEALPDRRPPAANEAPATLRRCARAKRAMERGRFDSAIRILQMAAWLDEASPGPHQYLANVYVLTGRLAAAIDEQRAALQRAPNNEVYRRNLESLERATARQTAPNRTGQR
jgi:tetratricopeptide (TPR) repeat protein